MAQHYGLLEHFLFLPTWISTQKLHTAIRQKTILITGASYGIGECIAQLLAKEEIHLILVARTEEKLLAVKTHLEQLGAQVSSYAIDLTQEDQVDQLISELKRLPNGIDIVISNAGHSIMRSIKKSLDRFHDFQRTMAINYLGPVRLLLGIIPLLEQKKGHIINISAVNVLLVPAPNWSAYQASKTAFDQWFRSAAPELKNYQINTSTVYLPLVRTRMIAPTKAYDKVPAMSPQHVAKIVGKLLYTRQRKYAPWWLIFGQLGSIIFRTPWEWTMVYFVKRRC